LLRMTNDYLLLDPVTRFFIIPFNLFIFPIMIINTNKSEG